MDSSSRVPGYKGQKRNSSRYNEILSQPNWRTTGAVASGSGNTAQNTSSTLCGSEILSQGAAAAHSTINAPRNRITFASQSSQNPTHGAPAAHGIGNTPPITMLSALNPRNPSQTSPPPSNVGTIQHFTPSTSQPSQNPIQKGPGGRHVYPEPGRFGGGGLVSRPRGVLIRGLPSAPRTPEPTEGAPCFHLPRRLPSTAVNTSRKIVELFNSTPSPWLIQKIGANQVQRKENLDPNFSFPHQLLRQFCTEDITVRPSLRPPPREESLKLVEKEKKDPVGPVETERKDLIKSPFLDLDPPLEDVDWYDPNFISRTVHIRHFRPSHFKFGVNDPAPVLKYLRDDLPELWKALCKCVRSATGGLIPVSCKFDSVKYPQVGVRVLFSTDMEARYALSVCDGYEAKGYTDPGIPLWLSRAFRLPPSPLLSHLAPPDLPSPALSKSACQIVLASGLDSVITSDSGSLLLASNAPAHVSSVPIETDRVFSSIAEMYRRLMTSSTNEVQPGSSAVWKSSGGSFELRAYEMDSGRSPLHVAGAPSSSIDGPSSGWEGESLPPPSNNELQVNRFSDKGKAVLMHAADKRSGVDEIPDEVTQHTLEKNSWRSAPRVPAAPDWITSSRSSSWRGNDLPPRINGLRMESSLFSQRKEVITQKADKQPEGDKTPDEATTVASEKNSASTPQGARHS